MDKTPRGLLATALFALLLVGGCAYQPGPVERLPDDPQTLLEQARQQEGEQAAMSRLEAADILARQGQRTQALEIATALEDQALDDDAYRRWALLLSRLGGEADDPSAVLRATQALDERDLPGEARRTLRERQGRALARIGEHLAAARALLAVQRDSEGVALNEDIWHSLSRLDGQQLAALEEGAGSLTAGWIELARLPREAGSDVERLFARLETWRERNPRHPAAREVPSDLLALRELRGQAVRHVAVMLPETGSLAGVAEAIREGIRTHHLNAVERNGGVRLSFFDSSLGDLDLLYAEARDAGAQVVIGPLDKSLVTRLENRDRVPLPTLALNYGEGERNRAENLYQYGLSAEDEARQVARRARDDGHRRAAMLIPDNEWGRRVGGAFAAAWQEHGGTLTNRVAYAPSGSATDSTQRTLAGGRPDMLFLLAVPNYARQVPPTLDYYDAGELPVYATSHLYEGRPQPLLDHDLDDVNFIDIPWQIPDAAVGGEEALPYLASYRALQEDADPSLFRLMAMGVDAYELALRLPQFRLLPESELFGATGTLAVGSDGRIHRRLPWARFESGLPRPVLVTDLWGDNGAPLSGLPGSNGQPDASDSDNGSD
ncbi:penicillin-binding protein activator [Halomonas sp. NO4]|uniref:penicillin-binding protein activator n=1 Tax=Halomonas sp. NO4 TaxID=2484813 RepID=UPI0013D814E5|nr:penicillin-binding protein activator [Halomonas sp. NO4]